MNIKVREWLRRFGVETTREEREEIDRQIERIAGRFCDADVDLLSETNIS